MAAREKELERFYSVNDLCSMFGVTRKTVYNWMSSGDLQFSQIGGRRRVSSAQLEAFKVAGSARAEQQEPRGKVGAPSLSFALAG